MDWLQWFGLVLSIGGMIITLKYWFDRDIQRIENRLDACISKMDATSRDMYLRLDATTKDMNARLDANYKVLIDLVQNINRK